MDERIVDDGFEEGDSSSCLEVNKHFYNPVDEDQYDDFIIVWGNYNKCTTDYQISRSDYPYYVLEYIIDGSGKFRLENEEWNLLPGMVFGFPPHTPHSYWVDEDSNLEKISIIFLCHPETELGGHITKITAGATFVQEPARIYGVFRNILEEGMSSSPYSREIMDNLFRALVYMVYQNRSINKPYNHSYSSFVRCREYMENNVNSMIQVSEIALRCNIDSSYMSRLFKKYMDCTPNQYLKKILVEKSIELLSRSDLPVKEIARELGFSNQYHFSSFFKKNVHISPTGFRNSGK
ncbi:MAG: AraC family transcriptional regulator [Spirochaetales bacterium]|nr:AraC family transcriptional regulator [Spirochaetales bacterium]